MGVRGRFITNTHTKPTSLILEIIQNFNATYHYAPDTLDIALRLGYRKSSMQRRLGVLRRAGVVESLPLTENGYGWQVQPMGVSCES